MRRIRKKEEPKEEERSEEIREKGELIESMIQHKNQRQIEGNWEFPHLRCFRLTLRNLDQ